jgi:hypothetical protein
MRIGLGLFHKPGRDFPSSRFDLIKEAYQDRVETVWQDYAGRLRTALE